MHMHSQNNIRCSIYYFQQKQMIMMNNIQQCLRYFKQKVEEKIGLCFLKKTIMNKAMLSYSVHHYTQFLQGFQKLLEQNSSKEIRKMWKIATICKTQLGCSKEQVLFYLQKIFRIVEDQFISFELAQRWEELYDNNRACMWLKETIKINPHFQDCYQRYFALVRYQKGVDEAVSILNEWYTHNIFNATVIQRIIEIHIQINKPTLNKYLYERLIALHPQKILYYRLYINLFIQEQFYYEDKFVQYCDKAIQLAQQPLAFYQDKMLILFKFLKFEQAYKCMQQMLRIDNKSIKPYYYLFQLIYQFQQAESISHIFQKQVKNGTIAYIGEVILSFAYLCLGKHQESDQLKLKLLSNTSQRYYSLIRGIFELIDLNFQTAIKFLEEFEINETPTVFSGNALALCYQKVKNYPKAIECYSSLQKGTKRKHSSIQKAVVHYKNNDFVEFQKLIDKLINTYSTFKYESDKFQLLQILIAVDQINFHKNIFDFQNLCKTKYTGYGNIQRHITLVQFYYKEDSLDVTYKRLCDLINHISADNDKSKIMANSYSSIVRVIEMCLNFEEYAKAADLLGILERFYKPERIYPQIAEWRQRIERGKQEQLTPKA